MSIARSGAGGVLTDDDGTGTTGTILNNSERQSMLDKIDARWTEQVYSSTGTQNNVVITSGGVETDRLNGTNASDVTVTGFVAPASPTKPGKPLDIYSTGAGNFILAHENASSTAANRINTDMGGISLYLLAGRGKCRLVYDSANSRWRVHQHVQGGLISYSTSWTAASGSAPAIGNGTIVSKFDVSHATGLCYIEIVLTAGSTTTFGSGGQLQFSLPFTASATGLGQLSCSYIDTGVATYNGTAYFASTTVINLFTTASPAAAVTSTAPFSFGNTDLIRVQGWYPLA